ncbi:Hpt domain-containing protein [Reinekea forsetii]|nr:Hpt domain-containing protein [Reinekea forsetii]
MFDEKVLNDLKDLLEEDFSQLINAYVRDLKLKVPKMIESFETGDIAEVQSLSHSLKGASKNIGVRKFAESCSAIEQLAKQSEVDELKNLIPLAQQQALELSDKLSELYLS